MVLIASVATSALLSTPASMAFGSHSGALRKCAPRNSIVITADLHAQVYAYGPGIYACLRSTGHITYLGQREEPSTGVNCTEAPEESCGAVSLETLAGDVVGYEEKPLGWGGRVIARSVATGATLHNVALSVAIPQRAMVEIAIPSNIVVNREGSIAWIQKDSFGRHGGFTPPPEVYDVFAVDSRGFESLRVGLPGEPNSLQLAGRILSWRQAGTPQSATLN